MHFIVIKARAARGAACLVLPASCCMPPAASCHLRNQHNCAAHQARRLTPCPSPHSLHSLGACHDGSNQTFYTWPTTTRTASTAGVKWRVAASGGKWQVAALLSICISSSSCGSPCRRSCLLLLTDSWHKLTSKRYLKRPSIRCEPVAIGIEWAGASQACCPASFRLALFRPAVIR